MAIPYKTYTQFKITPRPTTHSTRPKLFMQVYSRSNKLEPGKFMTITSPIQMYDYFPDDDAHPSVRKARLLINAGFNICVMNAYKANNPINIRFLNNASKTEVITTPYDSEYDDSQTSFELTNYTDSVMKVDLTKVQPGDYFILETNSGVNGVQSNLLIWFHDKTQEEIDSYTDASGNQGETFFIQDYLGVSTQFIYFHKGTGINLNQEEPVIFQILRIINSCPIGFYSFIADNYDTFFVCHNKGFINQANHSSNISLTLDDSYIPKVLLNTKTSQRVFEAYSQYNTDNNEEISLSIEELKEYIYRITVSKIYKQQILYQETFMGTTSEKYVFENKAERLTDVINNQSVMIYVNSYSDEYKLCEGTYFLKNLKNYQDKAYKEFTEENEIDAFINNLSSLSEDAKRKACMYYDSGVNSLRYQKALYKRFSSVNNLGLFVYRGHEVSEERKNIAYFADQTLYVDDIEFNPCEILLTLSTNNNFKGGVIEGAYNCTTPLISKDWVNELNADSIVTSSGIVGYQPDGQLVDYRYCIIEQLLQNEIDAGWDFTVDSVMAAIANVRKTFDDVFNFDPNIEISTYNKEPSTGFITIGITYKSNSINKVDTINITKNVNLH